jgi:LEA14-like dessication related protein
MRLTFILCILAFSVFSCRTPESPEFSHIENLVVDLEGFSAAVIKADAILYNPNNTTITIRSVDLDIMMDDHKVATLEREYGIKAQGMKSFTVPLDVKVQLKDLNMGVLGAMGALFGESGKEIRYMGRIKVKAYGLPFSVPVDYTETVKLKL